MRTDVGRRSTHCASILCSSFRKCLQDAEYSNTNINFVSCLEVASFSSVFCPRKLVNLHIPKLGSFFFLLFFGTTDLAP
jgi:hypothetical protein